MLVYKHTNIYTLELSVTWQSTKVRTQKSDRVAKLIEHKGACSDILTKGRVLPTLVGGGRPQAV